MRRRRVFYIPGYDPIHPRRYRELYRKEAARQAEVSGYEIRLSPKTPGTGRYGWHLSATQDGMTTETDMDVLVWSDIVRGSMGASIAATYAQLARTAWIYLSTGTLRRLAGLRLAPIAAALYPVLVLLAQLLCAVMVAGATIWMMWAAINYFAMQALTMAAVRVALITASAVAGIGIVWGVLRWFRKIDNRIYAYYLMHDYAFTARWRGAYPAALEQRMAIFRGQIAAALRENWDEVLVVGHSSGAHIGISILADVIKAMPNQGGAAPPIEGATAPGTATPPPTQPPALALLTLGHVVPMLSFLPRAQRLRRDLHNLSASDALTWVDVTAQGDGCTFALVDPVAVTGVAPKAQKWPLVFSAAFSQTMSQAEWAQARRRYFSLHFQYLCAFARPRDYDYFRITAGPLTLAQRYHDRPSSKNRITRVANRFRDMA
ncbi:hypothetical protein BFP70_08555 [Thioclava sp. SK-1]|nr:hypothetical protein BFP70_08555 [Thioclava sp. SK-1]